MADAESALGPNSSNKVLDLNNYGDCNQKDQVSLTFFLFFLFSDLNKCIGAISRFSKTDGIYLDTFVWYKLQFC